MNLRKELNAAAKAATESWVAANGKEDFGTCGSAVVLVAFGRKRKLKELFEAEHILGMSWDSGSKKSYTISYDFERFTQNCDYYNHVARAVQDRLQQLYPELEIKIHSWID